MSFWICLPDKMSLLVSKERFQFAYGKLLYVFFRRRRLSFYSFRIESRIVFVDLGDRFRNIVIGSFDCHGCSPFPLLGKALKLNWGKSKVVLFYDVIKLSF